MSRRKKKKRAEETLAAPSGTVEEVAETETGEKTSSGRPLRSRLAMLAVVLGVQLGMLGFFYAMAVVYSAEDRIHTSRSRSLPNKTVLVTTRILYGLPALLRSDPEKIVIRLGLEGKTPVEADAGPSGEATIALVAPGIPGTYRLELEADPDGSAGIGPLRSSTTLDVISITRAPARQP